MTRDEFHIWAATKIHDLHLYLTNFHFSSTYSNPTSYTLTFNRWPYLLFYRATRRHQKEWSLTFLLNHLRTCLHPSVSAMEESCLYWKLILLCSGTYNLCSWALLSLSLLLPPSFFLYPMPSIFSLLSSAQSLSCVQLFVTPWTAACQASLSITNSRSLCKLMSIASVVSSNHLILCCPLPLLPYIFPSIRVVSNESALCIRWPKYWSFSFSFSFSISPSNEYSGLISFRIDWFDLLAVQGILKSLI